MDVLAGMAVFIRVAELQSLSATARDLHVSQPAVSQKIAALEHYVGARLINRTTRSLALTEAGTAYLDKARLIMQAVDEAKETASGVRQRLSGHLRIQAPTGFGQMYLADFVIAFQAEHPELVIELILDDRYVDLTENGVDVAIRFGNLRASSLVARRLGTLRRIVVAAPSYISEYGSPNTPDQLADHRQVRYSWASTDDNMPLVGPTGSISVPVRTSFLANSTFVLTKALVAGRDLGGAQVPQICSELETGTLVRVIPDYDYAPLAVQAVYTSSKFVPAKVRDFIDYLKSQVSDIFV